MREDETGVGGWFLRLWDQGERGGTRGREAKRRLRQRRKNKPDREKRRRGKRPRERRTN